MALIILTSDGVVVFSAVTSLRESLSTSVSKNPVEKGYNISDGAVRNNTGFSFSGVISAADFKDIGADFNTSNLVDPVQISYNKKSSLIGMLPSSAQNLLSTTQPSITFSDFQYSDIKDIENAKNILRHIMEMSSLAEIIIYDSGKLVTYKKDCIITSVDFDENNSDNALYASVVFEEIITAVVESEEIDGQTFTADQISYGMDAGSNKGAVGDDANKKSADALGQIEDSVGNCIAETFGDGANGDKGLAFMNQYITCATRAMAEWKTEISAK